MTLLKKNRSIDSRFNDMGRSFTFILAGFLILNLALMFVFETQYDRFVRRMQSLSSLEPVFTEDLPDDLWEVIVGRRDFSDCSAYAMIDEVNAVLSPDGKTAEDTEIVVIRRTMDTMRSYVERIESNMRTRVPIAESEKLLSDIRDVGSLAKEMLEDHIARQIGREAVKNRQARVIFIACCAAEALLWLFFYRLTRRANRGLARYVKDQFRLLERFAGQLADGRLDARAPLTDTEELRPLTDSMNVMAEQLNKLIEQNKKEQENLKKSELRMLQAQINPHFLYNTLDAIMWQAEAKKTEEVIRITRALSDFFRISLSAGRDWITIEQERRHLEGYLSIQKVRYRDILNYTISIDDDIKDEIILKLLLQPLVENALYHGIKTRRGGGTISVYGTRDGDELFFSVHDTGTGIPPERLEEIRLSLGRDDPALPDSTARGSGFGLKNVDMRLRLYYGMEQGLHIESDENGTVVSFRLPAGMKGQEDV